MDLGHLAESAVYENDIMYIPLISEKRKLLKSYPALVPKDEKS